MPNLDDFDIDNLKSTWQNQKVEDAYQQPEIEAMLNKKSRGYVKYILWISIAEFLIFGVITIVSLFFKRSESEFSTILARLNIQNQQEVLLSMDKYYWILKLLSLIMTAIFVILFYQGYKRINVESNVKKFIDQILKFKKTVNAFIICNIALLVTFIVGYSIYISVVMGQQSVHLSGPTRIGIITGLVSAIIFSILLILLYYRLVYGILLKRLSKTMSQLEQIEIEKEA